MGRRQRDWAKRKRAELIRHLGGHCEKCGATEDLEIHHVYGRDYESRKLCPSARVSRYVREAKQGLIGVLCKPCNSGEKPLPLPPGAALKLKGQET